MRITKDDFDGMQKRFRATFINSISGFKSLQLVGTRGSNGVSNLAPFSSIVHIGSNPPLIGMIARPVTEEHQTYKNIVDTGFYTLNHVNENIYKQAHQASAKYDAQTSEFAACGFTELKSEFSDVPFVLEAKLNIMLKLADIIPIPLNGTSLIIGEIVEVLIADCRIESDGFVHTEDIGSITCSGVDSYYSVNSLGRIPYASIK